MESSQKGNSGCLLPPETSGAPEVWHRAKNQQVNPSREGRDMDGDIESQAYNLFSGIYSQSSRNELWSQIVLSMLLGRYRCKVSPFSSRSWANSWTRKKYWRHRPKCSDSVCSCSSTGLYRIPPELWNELCVDVLVQVVFHTQESIRFSL